MLRSKGPVTPVLLLISIGFGGCDDSHARSTPPRASADVARGSTPRNSKRPARDSGLTIYNNPGYGVSFRYPRNYVLEEEIESDDPSTLRTQQELEAEQPGAILVASVVVPDDAYPNTTFTSGHLQFAVNPMMIEETCRGFLERPSSNWPVAAGTTILPGISLQWRERRSVSEGIATINRDYAGFSNGSCYEFFLEVASTAASNGDGPSSHADVTKVRRPLEKIISSLELRDAPALAHSE